MNILVLLRLSEDYFEDELKHLLLANSIKKHYKNVNIDCVTMDRRDVASKLSRCAEFPIRRIYILNDDQFAGADTFLTSYVISRFIELKNDYDIIIGNHKSRYGETAHVPVTIASLLGYQLACNIFDIYYEDKMKCLQQLDCFNETIELETPCIITCAGIMADTIEIEGIPNLFQIQSDSPETVYISAKDIEFEKNEYVNVFSQVIYAEKIEQKEKSKQEIEDQVIARKILFENIGIN